MLQIKIKHNFMSLKPKIIDTFSFFEKNVKKLSSFSIQNEFNGKSFFTRKSIRTYADCAKSFHRVNEQVKTKYASFHAKNEHFDAKKQRDNA